MNRRRIISVTVMAVVMIGIIIGIKVFTSPGAPGGMPEHITIAQARGDMSGQVVKVGGDVVPGSIRWDNTSRSLEFILSSGGDQISVLYQGLAPNDFKPGSAMVVEGTYNSSGIFKATSITTQSSPLCKACHG